jgi:hypothetical protein
MAKFIPQKRYIWPPVEWQGASIDSGRIKSLSKVISAMVKKKKEETKTSYGNKCRLYPIHDPFEADRGRQPHDIIADLQRNRNEQND